jgi:hypothetical protein
MSGHITSDRFSDNDNVKAERLKKAEAELLRRNLGFEYNSSSTVIDTVELLEGDKDYHFLFNFLPNTEIHRYDLNINYDSNDVDKILAQSGAKLTAAKEYYLEKAQELNDFWQNVMPTREQYTDLVHLHHAKRYRLQRIVQLLNKEIAFNKEVEKTLETKSLTEVQEQQMIESFKKIDEQRTIAQANYLDDKIDDFRIPFFASDMPAADARIQKEMFLIKDVVLKDLNSNFYEAYSESIDQHIDNQVLAKRAHETGNPELSKLYGYMSQYGLNLKLKFLDVFNDKVEHGTITEESLEESLTFFNNNYGAMQERLFPKMVEAIENGATFEELVSTKDESVTSGFSGFKDEFDSIYNGLIEHAEGKKTIADLMREKAYKTTDLLTDGKVTDYELAQNVISSRRATFVYDQNYDLDNDGDIDDSDIAALNDVLRSKNSQFDRYNAAYDKFDKDGNGLISSNEASSTLTNYIDSVRSKDLAYDFNADGVINGHDLTMVKNILKADIGVDFDISGDQDTVIQNILNFTQKTAERRLELWDMQDAKLEEYYDSAGETYGARRQYYLRFLQTKWGDGQQAMGGAYIDSMLTHIAAYNDREDRAWFQDLSDPRAIEFNDRIELLNAAMDESLDIFTRAATKSDEFGNKWYGDYERYDEYVEDKVMSSLEIQKHRAATYGLFYKDADDSTTAQVDKLFDLLEVTYADHYNNRHNWNVDVNEENSLVNIADNYEEFGRNIEVGDVAISTLRSVNRLIYHSRFRAHELTAEQDNMYNEGLQEYINTYVDFREQLQAGNFTLESSEAELFQDKMEAKYDLLMSLGNLEDSTTKAVAFADKDGDGIISEAERNAAHDDFDYGMKMEQILKTNDLGISEEGAEYLAQFDFNGDGLLNELDYDILDNVVGIANEFPIHNVMNIINKQEKVVNFVDARIALENDPDSNMPAISEFLHGEIAFDQNVKNDYWKTAFKNNANFKTAYENIEKLRIQIMDTLEDGGDTSDLISQLNSEKQSISQNQTYNPKIEPTVGYLKFLDGLEEGSGNLVNKFLIDQEFFTPEVREALEYINTSSIPAETLINMLMDDPENFIEIVGYLKAAEKLELTDNFDQILAGGLGEDQINFLSAIGKFTESRNFIDNQEQNELFIQKLVDNYFGDGSLDTSALPSEYSDYADLMIKYSSGLNNNSINDDAQALIDEMTATLFNSSTISSLNSSAGGVRRTTFVSSRNSRRYLERGTYEGGVGGNSNNENSFYGNIKKIFKSDTLDSIEDLKNRDRLLSDLNLAEEDSDANKLVAQQYIQAQIDEYNAAIETKREELAALGNSRFNRFKILNLNKEIKKLGDSVLSKNQLQGLFA